MERGRVSTTTYLEAGAAALAVVGVVASAVVQFRSGRRLRRIERGGGRAVTPVPPDRAVALRSRARFSQGLPKPAGRAPLAVGGVVLCVLVAGGAAAWWFLIRGGGAATTPARQAHRTVSRDLGPDPSTVLPAQAPVLANKWRFHVAILNGSDVPGAARLRMLPLVRASGYGVGRIDNAPVSNVSHSIVMWAPGKRIVAVNVAHDLGIGRVGPLDGVPRSLTGPAQAVVVVGTDRAH